LAVAFLWHGVVSVGGRSGGFIRQRTTSGAATVCAYIDNATWRLQDEPAIQPGEEARNAGYANLWPLR
jgi:hypothetical protein